MPMLIADDAQLRLHIPNMVTPVKGETPLINRMTVFIDQAEQWTMANITSPGVFEQISTRTPDGPLRQATERLVAADAMRRAVPSLDVVLTPNGFGVVSTPTMGAASTPRVDRLAASMLSTRDEAIAQILPMLADTPAWLNTERAAFFGATLFPDLYVVDTVGGDTPKWERYLQLRAQILELEDSLADEYISPELMTTLRQLNLRQQLTPMQRTMVSAIQGQVLRYLRQGSFNGRRLADMVNVIRNNPDHFGEWFHTPTSQLFSPPRFHNRKDSHGFFF